MVLTPIVTKKIGLTTPRAAMVFEGLIGTTSGTSAARAATDAKLVPYNHFRYQEKLGCLSPMEYHNLMAA